MFIKAFSIGFGITLGIWATLEFHEAVSKLRECIKKKRMSGR